MSAHEPEGQKSNLLGNCRSYVYLLFIKYCN